MKKRAVAYVRVSTASSAQLHSYEFQEQYWQGRFENDPTAELICIYADRGISGSSINKRTQFLQMMEDARQHKFDEIHTKSVSRFARNTVELLEAVRELRDLGIEVIFEKEQIHTKQPTSEIFLTIAATIAENDLEVDSERMKWSIRRRYESGWINIGSGIYGYKMSEDKALVPDPQEAEIVKRIYDMYIAGAGGGIIARKLNEEGVTPPGSDEWTAKTILRIITNEKYMGDALMGKEVYIKGERMDNSDGKYAPLYYMEDSHEGIVSKEIWQKAQETKMSRENKKRKGAPLPQYVFTGMIECGNCHANYQHKVNNSGKKWRNDIWACSTQLKYGVSRCDCKRIKDSVLKEKFVEAYNEFVIKRPQGETAAMLQNAIDALRQEEREIAALRMQNLIPEEAFRAEQRRIKAEIGKLNVKLAEHNCRKLRESDFVTITEYSDEKVEKFISRITVKDNTVTFTFYNGVKISRHYTNGQPGNQVGWNKKEE